MNDFEQRNQAMSVMAIQCQALIDYNPVPFNGWLKLRMAEAKSNDPGITFGMMAEVQRRYDDMLAEMSEEV